MMLKFEIVKLKCKNKIKCRRRPSSRSINSSPYPLYQTIHHQLTTLEVAYPGRLRAICICNMRWMAVLGGYCFVVVAVLLLKIWKDDGIGVRDDANNNAKHCWQ